MHPQLAPQEIPALKLSVRGPVFAPTDAGFSDEVTAFNLAARHTPDLVVGAMDADDVAAAVAWAAQRGVSISVQSTGHGATNDIEGGLLISTRRMLELDIDPAGMTARAGAGVSWTAVMDATGPLGLMGLHGSTTDVGVVGYTLGGGLPVMGRKYGYASDHVTAFDLVTADGSRQRVTPESDPGLFSLLRGGKGNLGIVTALEFKLFPTGEFHAGGIHYPGAFAREVLSAFKDWAPTLPGDVSASLAFLRLPDLEVVPEPMRGQFFMHLRFAHQGTEAEVAELLRPMRACDPVAMDAVRPMPFSEVNSIHQDPEDPVPFRENGFMLSRLDDEAVEVLLELLGPGVDSSLLIADIRLMGGELSTKPAEGDCVGPRDAAFSYFGVGLAIPPAVDRLPGEHARIREALAPFSTGGTFINLHGHFGDAEDRARAWTPDAYARLVEAKAELDPQNLFRHGHGVESSL
ncbi:FAD-binding protein [Pseudarthrobacter psychrotolerans]|uniref:FAD-binding protein n=1 Tax=Pseudarthrobacter psychrotolerans TaxID=2697569 RepID=A0A6P1NP57_9MICC|nr:FAD-binding oxidoreductase [Pseudarthrobacter psychrotolerans]QHK21459.1 FAD-binding protein [Pseudarthrobacter psychrotolerans]